MPSVRVLHASIVRTVLHLVTAGLFQGHKKSLKLHRKSRRCTLNSQIQVS